MICYEVVGCSGIFMIWYEVVDLLTSLTKEIKYVDGIQGIKKYL